MIPRVFIGWDAREVVAYEVAERSLRESAREPVLPTPLRTDVLRSYGLYWRREQIRGEGKGRPMMLGPTGVHTWANRGQRWCDVSDAPMATEFANSRFLVPMLALQGWVLFTDCDVLFLGDVRELFALADPRYAVMCVRHKYTPRAGLKMDGQLQTTYARKNWSSVMLFNCSHRAHRRLTLKLVNETPGRDLHRFCWLDDSEIGELPPEWNWLVGEQPKPAAPKIAHYTLGGPWLPDWKGSEHDDLWLAHHDRYRADR